MRSPRAERGARTRLRRLALDLTPVRASRDFRLVWTGLLITSTGSQFTLVAAFVQVKQLTGSEAAVGATGLAWLVGLVTGTRAGCSLTGHTGDGKQHRLPFGTGVPTFRIARAARSGNGCGRSRY